MTMIHVLPCIDDAARAEVRRTELCIDRDRAVGLARHTLDVVRAGHYRTAAGEKVVIADAVEAARQAKVSLPPDAPLPYAPSHSFDETRIQVANETTAGAARRLVDHHKTIALNFANGFTPGGGFLHGARAQEESLCRMSALYETLRNDPLYDAHIQFGDAGTTSHAILSPGVPFFRDDSGALLDEPYLLAVLTCAAPEAYRIGQERAAILLRDRILRVLAIMSAFGYDGIVLGAWGCGAFGNDPGSTAAAFRDALFGPFRGAFREVVFAVTDWSPERRTLGPFRDAFAAR